jgi:hypothetical protein
LTCAELAHRLSEDRTKASVNKLINEVLEQGMDWENFRSVNNQTKLPAKWYMTWWLANYAEHDILGIESRQEEYWTMLLELDHEGMKRDLWKVLTKIKLNDDLAGVVFDQALKTIVSQKHAVAVRAYAMEVALNVALTYPELASEVIIIFESISPEEQASIRARKRMFLKKLRKVK